MNTEEDYKSRFEALENIIQHAYEQIEDGNVIFLGDLDKDVDALCTEIQNSSPDFARSFQSQMAHIINKLDDLVEALQTYKNKIQE